MYHVIFPTNFTKVGKKNIIKFINQFTPEYNPEVKYHLLHAYSVPKMGQSVMVDLEEELEKNAHEDMTHFVEEITPKIPPNITLNVFIREGSFQSVIHKFDKETEVNLVVLSANKESEFSEVLTQKNLSDLSHSLGEPIFYIPSKTENIIPKKVVFTTDLKPFSNQEDFKNFLKFLQLCNAKLEFLHIVNEAGDRYEAFKSIFYEDLKEFGMQNAPFIIINNEDVEQSIVNYIETEKPQMIGLIERGHAFFMKWFVTQTVDVLSSYDKLPLFVINEEIDKTKRKV